MAAARSLEIGDRSLAGARVAVFGQGPLGLMSALTMASQAADVLLVADATMESGVGFQNAAGLIEPVATADSRATRWLDASLRFYEWAQDDPAWGLVRRRVVFLSDEEPRVERPWMQSLPTYRRASDEECAGRRTHGAVFETFVLQPDRTARALKRELKALKIRFKVAHMTSIARAVQAAQRDHRADAVVLALGLGLADLEDVHGVAGLHAGLSAGVGVTIQLPFEPLGLDHVIMDDDDLGYLIPQIDRVIGGGTNIPIGHEEWKLYGDEPPDELVQQVRGKIARLWPAAADVQGRPLIGARPLRGEGQALTVFSSAFDIPVVLLGGAGGSGWTFCVGMAEDAADLVARSLSE